MLLLFEWKHYQQRYNRTIHAIFFSYRLRMSFPSFFIFYAPTPLVSWLWKRWLIFFNPSLVWRGLTEGSLRMQCTDNLWSICVGLQVTCNFTDKSYKYIWEWVEIINQEQIALLELTFHSVYWISWNMYSHSGLCKENDAKPKKMECKVGKLCCTCGFTHSNCWTNCSKRFFFLLLLLLLFMLWLFRIAKVWPISILLTAGQRGNVTLSHILQFATGAEEEPVLGFSIDPSIVFVDAENGFVPTANTCINSLKLVRPTISKPLPSEYALFKVFDYAFLNSYFGNM